MIRPQFSLDLNNELIVDNFAGGGGASTGIELALGRHVDIAINHDPEAVAMHQANHPQTLHLCESVFDVDPVKVTGGRPVGLAWFSPDCTHFSKARGTKPRSKKIRGLAWIIVRWAFLVRPRVIMMENVEEFITWGPLGEDGQPCPINKGRTFQSYRGVMTTGISRDNPDIPEILETVGCGITIDDLERGMGYSFEFQEERASGHGAPTIRKRLFGIARRDDRRVVWPAPTHGDPKREGFEKSGLRPFRTAAECIDWAIPCPSIFERKRPLAPATCRRIAKGIMRYVVNCPDPFIVPLTHRDPSDRVTTMDGQLPTVTAAQRGELAMVAPTLAVNTSKHSGGKADEPLKTICAEGTHHMLVTPVLTEHANQKHERNFAVDEPLRTQCAEVKGGHFAVVAPVVAGLAHGDHSKGAGRRTKSCREPVGTIHAQGGNHALVTPVLVSRCSDHGSDVRAASPEEPSKTITASGGPAVVSAFLAKHYGGHETPGWPLEKPASTVTAVDHHGLVSASLVGVGGRAAQIEPRPGDKPVQTLTGKADTAVAAVHLTKFRTGSTGSDLAEPMHTITAGPKENPAGAPHAMGMVTAHIEKMHGTSSGQFSADPLHTVGAQGTHFADVRAFLIKYYGNEKEAHNLPDPMGTVTTKDRFGLVTIKGQEFAIMDIGLRMLTPRELFRAQGFPESYIIGDGTRGETLRLTKSAQVRMCGNSVCPPMAAALVHANVPELATWSRDELKKRSA